ncbi:paraslipin [Haloferax mediterranei ATCC 33500]|uniref:Paraslipin n=1 Tax=Haloferax mediterranei (strain ATCC 33500 / DSM 1411 / JCM 8866 / NBRC 14739 / NCIMB 2177 / R-4) TaxID=523841 RepID=I3R2N1_HALMT|nr:stomatin-like protein [Haloferax mediterranei ATCC 33500]AHZ22128.1 stomatin-like protein [Haloferax mediterranei ATCC 33500]EMA02236.1 stomatin-like protein [Haloferax mediterranei ATCC 33500]QCQ74995.1 paraslipin [Haloferax mediterranei ATCC 33500]
MDVLVLQTGLGTVTTIVGLSILIFLVVTVSQSLEVVGAYEKRVLTVFGEYRDLLEPGMNFVPPFVSQTYSFDMRTQTLDVPRQEILTRDDSLVTVDAVVEVTVRDAEKAFLEADDYQYAVSNLVKTTLRTVLNDRQLDDALNNQRKIGVYTRRKLDKETGEFGVRVEDVEIREITPGADSREATEQQDPTR